MYPNLFVFLVAPPGGGKSRTINFSTALILSLPNPYIAPTSINAASIIDHLKECKRSIALLPGPGFEYNAMAIMVGEFGTFMSQYDDDLMAILTDMFNVTSYSQRRRGGALHITIDRPSLSLLIGTTPANLMKFMPEAAWGQGFASRIIFVYSEDKTIVDDFAGETEAAAPADLIHDLKIINMLTGKFTVTPAYRDLVNNWRLVGETLPSAPKPSHPRFHHYNARRKEQLYRLSMISAVNRSNTLLLTLEDFNTALGWLAEAEFFMPAIFQDASDRSDSAAMDDVTHFVLSRRSVNEQTLINYVRQKVPAYAVFRVIDLLERSGAIAVVSIDKRTGIRTFSAGASDLP
jgi:hypothetical protein